MKYIFLALFILFSLAHLYGSFIDEKEIRKYTKGFVLLCLLAYYLLAAGTIKPLIVAALAFSLIGDMLLLGKRFFVLGGVSFAFAHVCFSLAFASGTDFSRIPFWVYIVAGAVYIGIIVAMLTRVRHFASKTFLVGVGGYLLALSSTGAFALLQFISNPCFATGLIFVGGLFFLVSDVTLLRFRLIKGVKIWRNHFPIMITYIIAEFLIIYGTILLG